MKRHERKPRCQGCEEVQPCERLIEDGYGECSGCKDAMPFIRVSGGCRPIDHPPKKKPRTTELSGQRRMYRRGRRSL